MNNPIKTVSLSELPESAWVYLTGQTTGDLSLHDYYVSVPWLFRGVDIRASTVASMPFSIYKGDNEVDSSADYQNVVKILPNPKRLLSLVEASLTIWGYAYAIKVRSAFTVKDVRYLLATSVVSKITSAGEITFTRRIDGQEKVFTPDEIMYWWATDPFVEIGPPKSSPAQAAANAAGVLFNVDKFGAAFFERGAIKATLLTTKNIQKQERDRLKDWWRRMFGRGTESAWQTDIVNADAVTPVVIGEGLDSLENTDLSGSKRIDIAAALGIPYSVLFSNASNRSTAEQDDLHLYTKTIIPECELIEEVLNAQLFSKMGYRFKFTPENLDIFQEDENARAASLAQLIAALGNPFEFLLAADILGYEISADTRAKIERLIAEKDERRASMADLTAQAQVAREEEQQLEESRLEEAAPEQRDLRAVDMGKWKNKALKRVRRGQNAACTFESEHIDPVLNAALSGALEGLTTEEEVTAVFGDAWKGYP